MFIRGRLGGPARRLKPPARALKPAPAGYPIIFLIIVRGRLAEQGHLPGLRPRRGVWSPIAAGARLPAPAYILSLTGVPRPAVVPLLPG